MLKHYFLLLTGKTKAKHPAKLTWKNIKAVFQAYYRKGRELSGFQLPDEMYEQIVWRRVQVMTISPKCWEEGACKICGCEILGKTMEDRGCENESPCYPPMMNAGDWKNYKKTRNIKLFEC